MKYMGHKGKLLPILGEILIAEAARAKKIADPFCGSGVVSWYLAENTEKSVISGDLQAFAAIRAGAVTERVKSIEPGELVEKWFARAQKMLDEIKRSYPEVKSFDFPAMVKAKDIRSFVFETRRLSHEIATLCRKSMGSQLVATGAYGGHYFSLEQALQLDALRGTISDDSDTKKLCIAALVGAASKCAASPGHTAQPFQPTATAKKYIVEAWGRSIWEFVRRGVNDIAPRYSKSKGISLQKDYLQCIDLLSAGDLVFADPPYSAVHYSRFYHVLETLTAGRAGVVSGVGRYPPRGQRPISAFSRKSESFLAAKALVDICAKKELGLVLTFPSSRASNGLSASDFVDFAKKRFSSIETVEINSVFSTLGGGVGKRSGKINCTESVIVFRQ